MSNRQSAVTISAPIAKLATTPTPIAWLVIVAKYNRLPAVTASYRPIATTVPHESVGVGNVMTAPLLICSATVAPPLMADQPVDEVIGCRAYAPPDTSVPPVPASDVGAVVKSAT